MADKKPDVSSGESRRLPGCTVVAGHNTALTPVQCDPSTGDALSDPDYAKRL